MNDSFKQDLRLRTGEMHRPMEAMRACFDELLTHWELDAEAQRTLSRRVAPVGMASWVPRIQASYPSNLQGQGGRIRIWLVVGPEGKPMSCSVQLHISHTSFEEAACAAAMRHARFEPALDAQGSPIASYYGLTLVFERAASFGMSARSWAEPQRVPILPLGVTLANVRFGSKADIGIAGCAQPSEHALGELYWEPSS